MSKINFVQKVDHEQITKEWIENIRIIEPMTVEESYEKYWGLDTGYEYIDYINQVNTARCKYNPNKKILVCEFDYLPGVPVGTTVEIHNVQDITDAYFKFINFFTAILCRLNNLVPRFQITDLIEKTATIYNLPSPFLDKHNLEEMLVNQT